MNDKWLNLVIRIQSIAQAGLQYGKDPYDIERYEELRQIAAEMMAEKTGLSAEKVYGLFCNESGYQTPKIDTRAALFIDDKILLVHENNGKWSLPGGWCDVDQSIVSNTLKELKEEAGIIASAEKLIAIQDWRKHNATNYAYGVMKTFVLCQYESGGFEDNIETIETGFFKLDELPQNLAIEKCTREQIEMCFEACHDPNWVTIFE